MPLTVDSVNLTRKLTLSAEMRGNALNVNLGQESIYEGRYIIDVCTGGGKGYPKSRQKQGRLRYCENERGSKNPNILVKYGPLECAGNFTKSPSARFILRD